MSGERAELYKAAKYEVNTFPEDCDMTLPEMWAAISKQPEDMTPNEQFWWATCLRDYEQQNQ